MDPSVFRYTERLRIGILVHCSNLDFGYDGLLVRRLKLPSTDWKSVVQVFLNPNS